MKVTLANPAGACYGVDRALSMVDEALLTGNGKPVHTLGPLIHNPIVVSQYEGRGVKVANDVDDVDSGVLVIRSHGVPMSSMARARVKGLEVVDATCPHVSRAQQEASRMASDGYRVIIVGESGHPEVEAILSYAGENAMVVQDETQIPQLDPNTKIGVVVQTTQPLSKLENVVAYLNERYTDVDVENTIYKKKKNRQEAALELSGKVDAMVVIGGRNSGNTTRLYEICRDSCQNTHHIESADELDPSWFTGCESIGVTAGASTPQAQIKTVVDALEKM